MGAGHLRRRRVSSDFEPKDDFPGRETQGRIDHGREEPPRRLEEDAENRVGSPDGSRTDRPGDASKSEFIGLVAVAVLPTMFVSGVSGFFSNVPLARVHALFDLERLDDDKSKVLVP